jgi:WD40 repeat protein
LIAAGSEGGHGLVKIWDAHMRTELLILQTRSPREAGAPLIRPDGGHTIVFSAIVSPDGRTLATGSDSRSFDLKSPQPRLWGELSLWDARTGEELALLQRGDHVCQVVFSPDGRFLASCGGSGREIRVWDTSTRKQVVALACPPEWPGADRWAYPRIAFSPDGKTLACANFWASRKYLSGNGTVYLWRWSH